MPRLHPDRRAVAPVVVWLVWAAMLGVVLLCIIRYGRDIPLAEDWTMVPALTGHEPHFLQWLWSQNNEHRVPLPRLLFLALLRLSGGDFRSGMLLNTAAVAAVAAAMILTVRRLRGHTALQDAFFPLALLHLGHWLNLVWSWQLQFVASFVLVSVLLLVIVRQEGALSRGGALLAASAIVLLPFTGAIGLIFDVALAPWVLATAWRHLRRHDGAPARGTGILLLAALAVAGATALLYFVGYERPPWNPPSPSHVATLETAARFLALAFGPWASSAWRTSVLAALLVLLLSALALAWATLRGRGAARLRPFGLLCFGGAIVVLALGIGWGRAAQFPTIGLPARYVLFAVPTLCGAYFIAQLFVPARAGAMAQGALCAVMLVLLPGNTRAGLAVRDWYVSGMAAVERDIAAGVAPEVIAARHRPFLMHWDEAGLGARIRMLRDARLGPFARVMPQEGSR